MEQILLVEDEPSLQLALGDLLADEGFLVDVVGTVADALRALKVATPDLILSDLRLPDGDGLTVLRAAQQALPDLPVVILTAYATVGNAVTAIKAGAVDYLTKPFDEQYLLAVVRRHLELGRLRRRVETLEGVSSRPLGSAPSFCAVVDLARTVAASDATVLILGETGTGKEVLARFIHESSPRRGHAFIPVNCAALPETLLESELFGHERGAFTGALQQRRGRFEDADGGTLLLDEVAEMSPAVQAKLLRVLQEQRFERLGSNRQVNVDVRIIAATRRDLQAEVQAGRFRDDLYYRLKVVPIAIPPLRERPGDIALLAHYFARRFAADQGRKLTLAPETLECLAGQPFPGNVRELEHLVQRLAVVCPVDEVRPEHLPEEYNRACRPLVEANRVSFSGSLAEMEAAFEKHVLAEMLRRFDRHRGRIAQALGISRKSLWEKLKAHGLDEKATRE